MDFDLDLGIDEKDLTESAEKGLVSGVTQGVKAGIKEGVKPLAEEAGKKAINNLIKGDDEFDKVISEMGKIARINALQGLVKPNVIQQPQIVQQNPQTNPVNELIETISTLQKAGLPTENILSKLDVNKILMLNNPQLMPLLMNQNQGQNQNNGNNSQLLSYMMMMMNNQKQQQPIQPQASNNELVVELIRQLQASQEKMTMMYQELQNKQQELLIQQIQPYLAPKPSWAEELDQMRQKIESLKGMGLLGNDAQPVNEIQAQLALEAKRMSNELEREKLRMDREDKRLEMEMRMKQNEQTMMNQLIEMGLNVIKNLKISPRINQITAPNEYDEPTQSGDGGIASQFSERINSMIRKRVIKKDDTMEE